MIQKWCSLLILLLMGSLPAIAYDITVVQPSNGTITVKVGDADATTANTTADADATVTIEITPTESYFLSVVTVHVRKYVTGNVAQTRTVDYTNPVSVTTVNKGKYTFTMPNRDVEVSADFTVVEAEARDMGENGTTPGTYYETLAEAITAAESGHTVQLWRDVTASVTINKNITLDLRDKTLTAAEGSSAITLTEGTVTIKGGTITGGNVDGNGGGINVTGGTLTLDGVNVTGNQASGNGGGVYFAGTALYLKSAVKITGNTKGEAANNLYLPSGKKVDISNGLASGASIGVTLASTTGTFTTGNGITTFDPTTYFSSDNASYVVLHELDDSNQAQIYSYSGDDGNIHWVYDRANTTLTISKKDPSGGSVAMPDYKHNDNNDNFPEAPWLPFHSVTTSLDVKEGVTTIGKGCCGRLFKYFTSLTSVSLPEGITSIGDCAFRNCTALTTIELPSSLITIIGYAFQGVGLTSIVVPPNVSNIGEFAFVNCASLTTFVLLKTNGTVSLGKNAFLDTNSALKIYVPNSKVSSYKKASNWKNYSGKINGWTYDMTETNTTLTLEADEADCMDTDIKPAISSVIINGAANIVSEDANVNALNLTHTFSNADVPVTAYTVEYAVNTASPVYSTTLPNAVNNYLVHVKGGVANQDYSGTSNTANFYIKRNMANEGIVLDGTRQWDTYYASEDLALPTGVAAYIVTAYSNTAVTTSSIDYIPKNVGVLLYSASAVDAADLKASAYTGATSTFGSNILRGGVTTMESGGANYILFNNAFVLADGTSLADKRCYIHLSAPAATRSLSIDGGDGTTGINSIENGKLNIENDSDVWYDMSGRRLQGKPVKKGLYIRNGKKIVIK